MQHTNTFRQVRFAPNYVRLDVFAIVCFTPRPSHSIKEAKKGFRSFCRVG